MIDSEILRKLGWSDELIAQVLRQASELGKDLPEQPMIRLPFGGSGSNVTDRVAITHPTNFASDRVHYSKQ